MTTHEPPPTPAVGSQVERGVGRLAPKDLRSALADLETRVEAIRIRHWAHWAPGENDALAGCLIRARAALAAQPAADHLGNLLARIHGDGGHYVGLHGLDKAVADADAMVAEWRATQPATAKLPSDEWIAEHYPPVQPADPEPTDAQRAAPNGEASVLTEGLGGW